MLRDGTVITTNPSLSSIRDFGATIGGPILKDKLWFYAGVQAAFSRYDLERHLSALQFDANGNRIRVDESGNPVAVDEKGNVLDKTVPSFTKVVPIDGTSRRYATHDQTLQYIGKLTYLFNQDHNVTLSIAGTPNTSGGNGALPDGFRTTNLIGPYSAYAAQNIETANDLSLKYSGAFSNKTRLLDVTFGWHHQRRPRCRPTAPRSGAKRARRACPRSATFAATPGRTRSRTSVTSSPESAPPASGR